jgi:regulator of sigma E protease
MELLLGILAGLVILTVLIVVHELGHALVARRNGVVVEEFGIGFPPLARGKRIAKSILGKNVLYSLNWIPAGGFVKLQGEHDEAKGKKGDFGRASFWAKTKILFAGVMMNWVTAAVLLTILAPFGIPKIIDNQFSVPDDTTVSRSAPIVQTVADDSPAQELGLEPGDVVESFAGQSLTDGSIDLADQTEAYAGQTVDITYTRDGESRSGDVSLNDANEDGTGYLGIGTAQREMLRSTWSAPIVGVGLTAQLSWLTLEGIGDMLSNFVQGVASQLSLSESTRQAGDEKIAEASAGVAGPVGLLGVVLPGFIEQGLTFIIFIAAIISLSLAVLNTLPIPGLDGGRWTVIAVYRALNRPLTKEREEAIVGGGMLVLLGLFVLITIADIGKIVG